MLDMIISSHIEDIITILRASDTGVLSLVSPTGSGKSLGVPLSIANLSLPTKRRLRIMISVPTRAAVESLKRSADYIQDQVNQKISPDKRVKKIIVGTAASRRANYDQNTQVIYATSGHVRKRMLQYFYNGKVGDMGDLCDILMLDEYHNGSLDNTIMLSLWRAAAAAGVLVPRVIVSSAVIFSIPQSIPYKEYVVKIEDNLLISHSVTVTYMNSQPSYYTGKGLTDGVYTEAIRIIKRIHNEDPNTNAHMLIFVPGRREVTFVVDGIGILNNAKVIPAYSKLTKEQISDIYSINNGIRKIIIATNVAETSITIENVTYIIDTLLEKVADVTSNGGFRLVTKLISKASAEQRKGRTGRTGPGVVYRLIDQDSYNKLADNRLPEIQRIPLFNMIIEMLNVGLVPQNYIVQDDNSKIAQSMNTLEELSLIKVLTEDKTVIISDAAKFSVNFPLGIRNSKFLYDWIEQGYQPFTGIVLAVLIDSYGPSYFIIPYKTSDINETTYNSGLLEYRKIYFSQFMGNSDIHSLLLLWNAIPKNSMLKYDITIATWVNKNKINGKKINELLSVIRDCIDIVGYLRGELYIDNMTIGNIDQVVNNFRLVIIDSYIDRLYFLHNRKDYMRVDKNIGTALNIISTRDIYKTNDELPSAIVALSSKTTGGKLPMNIINLFIDVFTYKNGAPIVIFDPSNKIVTLSGNISSVDNSEAMYQLYANTSELLTVSKEISKSQNVGTVITMDWLSSPGTILGLTLAIVSENDSKIFVNDTLYLSEEWLEYQNYDDYVPPGFDIDIIVILIIRYRMVVPVNNYLIEYKDMFEDEWYPYIFNRNKKSYITLFPDLEGRLGGKSKDDARTNVNIGVIVPNIVDIKQQFMEWYVEIFTGDAMYMVSTEYPEYKKGYSVTGQLLYDDKWNLYIIEKSKQ